MTEENKGYCCCDCQYYHIEGDWNEGIEERYECLKYQHLVDGLDNACEGFVVQI